MNSPKNMTTDCKKGWLKGTHSPIIFLAGIVLAHLKSHDFQTIQNLILMVQICRPYDSTSNKTHFTARVLIEPVTTIKTAIKD